MTKDLKENQWWQEQAILLQPRTEYLGKNIVFLHYTAYFWKKHLPPVSMLLSSGSMHRMPKNNIDNWGKGKFLVFVTIFVHGCLKNEKSKKKGQVLSTWIQNKFVVILVIYYFVWNKWPRPVTNACLGEEKQRIIQNKPLTILCTTWLYWIINKTATDFNSLYYMKRDKIRLSATKYIFSYIQDQNTNLYVQRPINNRKTGKLYWCLNNPDSWKIQQILRARIVGKISEL